MAEKKIRRDPLTVAIAIISVIIGLIGLYLYYLQTKKVEPPIIPGNGNGGGGGGPGPIPGQTQVWSFDEIEDPARKTITIQFVPLHLASITGQFQIVDSCPGCKFKKAIGVRGYAWNILGERFQIFKDEPYWGIRTGWRSFGATVGLNDIVAVQIKVSKLYGFGDDVYRIKRMLGEMIVIV